MVSPEREVRDDVALLTRVLERLLEQLVEVRRDDQLRGDSGGPQHARQLRQRPMHQARGAVAVEKRVEGVVQRADPSRHGDVLGDVGEIARVLGRTVERPRQLLRPPRPAPEGRCPKESSG